MRSVRSLVQLSKPRRWARTRIRLVMFVGIAALLVGASVAAYATNAFRDLELDTVDSRFALRGDAAARAGVVVVAIDDVTFGELDQRWPFPRSIHAEAVDALRAAGASVIAYDVQFTEQTDPDQDEALIEAVDRAGGVVLATTEVDARGNSGIFGGDEVLKEIGARAGHGLLPNDPGGVLRRMPHSVDGLTSFSVAAAEEKLGRRLQPAELGGDTAWIDYEGPPGSIETVSFSRLVEGKAAASLFKGKVVIVGPSAPSLQDIHPTSTAAENLMSGAEIQAHAVSTALRGFPLRQVPAVLDVGLIILLGLAAPLVGFRFGPLRAVGAGLALALLFTLGAQAAFQEGLIVSFVYPALALVLGVLGALGMGLVAGAFERQRVRDLFARFVPEAVVDEVLAHVDEDLRLGGEWRVVTVLFSDVRGFTTYSETREPDQVLEVLNRYLTEMSNVILDNGGTLVSYIGDGIMAAFGAPIDQPNHADRAVATAREMSGEALERFNRWVREEGLGEGFRIGIGLNSGAVMAGNVGSERRLEYTMIGDTVNTAARLEGMTKGTPYMIYLADSTRLLLTGEPPDLERVDELPIRGRTRRVEVWALASNDGENPQPP